ncbi:hypothetical protein D3C71_1486710 [compost metagenome]
MHPGVDGGAQLAAHLGGGDHGLAVEVAAALGKGLVFQLDHGRARPLEAAHGALRVQRIAKAGIGIDDDGRGHPFGNAGQRVFDLGVRGQADVRAAQARIGDGRAGQVQRAKARLFGHQRRQGVVDAGSQHGARGQLCFQVLLLHCIRFLIQAAPEQRRRGRRGDMAARNRTEQTVAGQIARHVVARNAAGGSARGQQVRQGAAIQAQDAALRVDVQPALRMK